MAPDEVRVAWQRIQVMVANRRDLEWQCLVVERWLNNPAPLQSVWQPVPLGAQLTPRGELYCVADMINRDAVWLYARGFDLKTRVMLPENVRLCATALVQPRW